ncbi:glutamate--tRNA ligase [Alphaproteobacteria bacterium]|nr:glutamate--tRNA ligase [Alphaproteobacteria bacterium]MDC1209919.1 glutamate--tRNA ligase [Pseudomonadota bacterium]
MVKVRFAPSPTGHLHIGNFRTALVNFLFARKENGHFMLRIDDTDDERSTLEFEKDIINDLKWMNFNWDSIEKQSSRLERYNEALNILLDKKRAYACYETAEELSLKRKVQLSSGKPPVYDRSALRLSDSDIATLEASGKKPHYRFLLDHSEIKWNDLVKGESKYNMSSLSDPVILREDGRVIYTLASVVDDIDFDITHILRGEDHMTNSAAQIQLFESLGSIAPNLGHLSLLTDISGSGLSKRLGSLSLQDLRNEGVNPMAISSLLSKIGSSDSVEAKKDIENIIISFDINKFGKSKPKFDKNELLALNSKVLQLMEYDEVLDDLNKLDLIITKDLWYLVRGNISLLKNVKDWSDVCFGNINSIIEDGAFITQAAKTLPEGEFNKTTWSIWTKNLSQISGRKGKDLYMPLRLCLTGYNKGPEMADLILIIGRDKVLKRLSNQD